MRPVIVFDVNETLLDLTPIREGFAASFGDEDAASVWFTTLLELSFVDTITGAYHPFTELAQAAFTMVARARGVTVPAATRDEIVGRIRTLPPHPDVEPALRRLDAAGFRLAALTNSPPATAKAQLANAGLADLLEKILSVEMVRRFKPARQVYETAAARLRIPITALLMVAAHDWDVAGAMAAGGRGAFVARPGRVLSPLQPEPDVVGPDLEAVATAIVARFGG